MGSIDTYNTRVTVPEPSPFGVFPVYIADAYAGLNGSRPVRIQRVAVALDWTYVQASDAIRAVMPMESRERRERFLTSGNYVIGVWVEVVAFGPSIGGVFAEWSPTVPYITNPDKAFVLGVQLGAEAAPTKPLTFGVRIEYEIL